jgi:D-3-phosphoglycerate dehydrogenase
MPKPLVMHVDPNPVDALAIERAAFARAEVEFLLGDCRSEDEVAAQAAEADAILTRGVPIGRRAMPALRRCRVIVRYGVGVDSVDLEAATDRGIVVANVPDFCVEEVSNHALLLLMACAKKLLRQDRFVRGGGWGRKLTAPMGSIHGQTLGLLGFGNIGRAVAVKARALGMEVVAYDPYVAPAIGRSYGVRQIEPRSLLENADYVSAHLPLTEETREMISEPEFRAMKSSAFFINTSRGRVVDEPALIRALREGWIAGAGLDVLAEEPPRPDNPLLAMENVILTPHTASYSDAAWDLLARRVAESALDVLEGRRPRHVANPAVLERVDLAPRPAD